MDKIIHYGSSAPFDTELEPSRKGSKPKFETAAGDNPAAFFISRVSVAPEGSVGAPAKTIPLNQTLVSIHALTKTPTACLDLRGLCGQYHQL